MMIREPTPNMAEPKILKVRLPTEVHLRLHSLKILTGKSISDAVGEALDAYFAAAQAARSVVTLPSAPGPTGPVGAGLPA